MLGVTYVSFREKLFPFNLCLVSHMFNPMKNYSLWNSCEIYASCPICFFPVKNYSAWNLCLVSHMFLPVKNYSLWKLCLVSHRFLPVKNYPRENYAWCPICFFSVKNYSRWNLCLLSHMFFFPVKNYSLWNLCFEHLYSPRMVEEIKEEKKMEHQKKQKVIWPNYLNYLN